MKEYRSEDGLQVWLCQNGMVGFGVNYDHAELSAKDVGKLIIYLTRILMKGVVQ